VSLRTHVCEMVSSADLAHCGFDRFSVAQTVHSQSPLSHLDGSLCVNDQVIHDDCTGQVSMGPLSTAVVVTSVLIVVVAVVVGCSVPASPRPEGPRLRVV
jgi:hypothetical protein